MRLIILAILFIPTISMGLESDQYLMWGRELRDVSNEINLHVNQVVENSLKKSNGLKKSLSCEEVHSKAVKEFRGFIIHKIETWLEKDLGQDLFPVATDSYNDYYRMSIYNFKASFIGRFFPMGRNMNFNQIYIGSDKLAHFFSTGLRYFTIYQKQMKKGKSPEQAMHSAIDFGITMENSILGKIPSGVYSFGDLEANFQGLLFNRKFCEDGENSYLAKNSKQEWYLANRIDLNDYINPFMDESFNPSHFIAIKWLKVKPRLKLYCGRQNDPDVVARFDHYRQIIAQKDMGIKTFSRDYLAEIRNQGHWRVPDPKRQILESICQ